MSRDATPQPLPPCVEGIKIVDVILHRNQYSTQTMVILNRMPSFVYARIGNWLLASDGPLYDFLAYERSTQYSKAFAGRKFTVMTSDGPLECSGDWWSGTPKEFGPLAQIGIATPEVLERGYCFMSGQADQNFVADWLKHNEPSNNYYKYCRRDKNFGVHRIAERFDAPTATTICGPE